jgi:hypothetical protein
MSTLSAYPHSVLSHLVSYLSPSDRMEISVIKEFCTETQNMPVCSWNIKKQATIFYCDIAPLEY